MQTFDFEGFDPEQMTRIDAYRMLTNCVAPRPIAFVATVNSAGQRNLSPFSFFMAGGANPLSVVVSPCTDRDNNPKHTLRNIQEVGEYTINIVSYGIRERMNQASAEYPYGVDEWAEAGFEALPGVKVQTEHVADAPMAMECKVYQVVPHGLGPTAANYVIGEVVYFHIAQQLLTDNGTVDPAKVDHICRLGGDWYGRLTRDSLFELPRPQRPK